jgi:flavodoxin
VTASVAEALREIVNGKGLEVDSFFVADADKEIVENYDCLLAGAPTMAFRASKGIMQFLNSLHSAGL